MSLMLSGCTIVYQRYKSSRDSGMMGEKRMQYFMLRWSHALQAAGKVPSEVGRQETFYARLGESRGLRWDPKDQKRGAPSTSRASSTDSHRSGPNRSPSEVKMVRHNFMDGKCESTADSCDYAHRPANETDMLHKQMASERRYPSHQTVPARD